VTTGTGPLEPDPVDTDPLETVLAALGNSHARLAAIVGPLTAEEVAGPSYDDDWSIAQVLSHLGSGAEIFGLILEAGRRGEDAPGMEQFQEVWARWNAKSPAEQARDGVAADAAFLSSLGALDPAERERWRLSFFGDERGLSDVAQMRLSEHAVHTWDVAVALDSKAALAGDAVELILDTLPGFAPRIGKPAGETLSVHVTTYDPDRHFRLDVGPDSVSLSPAAPGPLPPGSAVLRLPAEAFVRLVVGRLKDDDTPGAETENVDLAALRRVFPGF
jgi:uncharacterized protein (TIGR03083 family)